MFRFLVYFLFTFIFLSTSIVKLREADPEIAVKVKVTDKAKHKESFIYTLDIYVPNDTLHVVTDLSETYDFLQVGQEATIATNYSSIYGEPKDSSLFYLNIVTIILCVIQYIIMIIFLLKEDINTF